MKNLPLALQIWVIFAAITLSISILLAVLFPWTLRDFFTREIYATIESAQWLQFNRFNNELSGEAWESGIPGDQRQQLQNIRTVHHFLILSEDQTIVSPRLSPEFRLLPEFLNKVTYEAKEQTFDSQRYSGQVEDEKIFYVINKGKVAGHDVFLISYMWDSYRQDLVQTLFTRLVLIMSLVFLLSWIPSFWLAKYLSNPLASLEKRVKKLTNREWQAPVQLERQDEIGRLGQSIEQLRKQLIRHDEDQQLFLQHVSHELKTPVMVIRSYTQAIKDGIFPKGDLAGTVEVVEEEAGRLENRIRNLLYLTKLDYLATHKPSREIVAMDKLISDIVERFRWRRSELDWSLELSPVEIRGDIEQWGVVLENLLDNQIRYADKRIVISLTQSKNNRQEVVLLHIWNDGPAIEPETISTLFDKFNKGYQGEFGLGLAIVQRIVSLHDAKIWAKNEEEGVSFYLEIPLINSN